MSFLIVSTSASENSVSRKAVPVLLEILTQNGIDADVIDIRQLSPVWVNDRDINAYPSEYLDLFEKTKKSLGVFFVFPIYCYTFSSATKAITEIIGDALENKPVACVAASGSLRSHLSVGHLMQSLMYEQDTICYPSFALLNDEMLDGESLNEEAKKRVIEVAEGFLSFVRRLSI